MKFSLFLVIVIFLPVTATAQFEYEPSDQFPFGQLNPDAPDEVGNFGPMIGVSECISETRAQDGTWNPPHTMLWKFKYIMNGMAVQDEVLRTEAPNAGSIRQFNPDSSAWYVHYYSSGSAPARLPTWEGSLNDEGEIVLYREQKAPNGNDGFYKIRFYDITENSFEWLGAWVNTEDTFSYPTWKISCIKQ